MQKAEKRLNAILKKAKNSNITDESLSSLEIVKVLCSVQPHGRKYKLRGACIVAILSAILFVLYPLHNSECFLEFPIESSKIFREPEDCDICVNVTEIDRVANISHFDFEKLYVAKGKPLVVTDGTNGWSAVETFSFDFFKQLYESAGEKNDQQESKCQFFPYKTEFRSLMEVFNMSPERSRLETGTEAWYVGWSNCNDRAGKILRQHYKRPYFLPDTSENIALNWIFMGGPGSGAHMHVDNVVYPSWQAQIRGQKTWTLAPPPECFYKCKRVEVTVHPGEIIVIDTNRWYHQTHILPGSISITIGSEFD